MNAVRARLRDASSALPAGLVARLEVNTLRDLRARRGTPEVRVVIATVVFAVLAAGGDIPSVIVAGAVAICYATLMVRKQPPVLSSQSLPSAAALRTAAPDRSLPKR